ncbi:unnamed protein product [Rotaria magnacalcarata]|uniref:Uncharacterized protein n=2 Tax=Rotaria magnacalcarata TaxID=392030 RepID=A0A8S2KRB3_9BILA|nr:unnamed protein product [Rotaria magnacalcarata]
MGRSKKQEKDLKIKRKQRRVLKRLFRYSRPDWLLITFGTILLLGAALCKGFLGGFRIGIFSVCVSRLNIRLRTKLFQSYLRQEIGFFDTNESGKLLSRLNHDTQIMSSTVANNIPQCIGAFVKFVGTFIMMIKLSFHLTIACLIGAPLILIVTRISGNAHGRISEKVQDLSADASEIAEETIQTIRTVRSFGNEDGELKRFAGILKQAYKASLVQAALSAAQKWFVELAQLGMSVVMLSYGAHLVRNNRIAGPDLLAFVIYQLTLGSILTDISQIYTALMTAAGASQSVFDYLDRKSTQRPNGTLQPAEFRGEIEFNDVSLFYPARPDEIALQNVTFKIEQGQTCAFVGPSGSGKSSCINLLERFYDPSSGTILIDGREIHDYDHKYLHQKIAMVGQEPILFNRTIKENIAYAIHDDGDDDDDTSIRHETTIMQAAEQANAHGFVTDFVNGYNTICGQRGGHLSGGQKQRISIARAIIRQPTILLLDEATSALDPVNERLIHDALFYNKERQEQRTVLISAHRLSTIERCDKIFVIHKGQLIEQGTHEELMDNGNGLYRELVRRQNMDIDCN